MKLTTLTTAIALLAAPAFAELERSTLHTSGFWDVSVVYDEDTIWCEARTGNKFGQEFRVVAWPDDSADAFISDPKWNLSKRQIEIRVDVDYEMYRADAMADGVLVHVPDLLPDFIYDLMKGAAVALYNDRGQRLALFSLKGSAVSIKKLAECQNKIMKTQNTNDPFGPGTSDPF